MNPVQKWQQGLPLTANDKTVIRNFGYNPDSPYQQQSLTQQGSQLIGAGINQFQPAAATPPATPELTWEEMLAQFQESMGGGQATPAAERYKLYGGKQYDFENPDDRLAYYNVVKVNLQQQREEAELGVRNAFEINDRSTVNQYKQYLSQLDQNIVDIESEAKSYVNDYLKTVKGFNESKGVGDVNRQGYFAQISPNAFQSSQASSQGYADEKYLEGLTDLAGQAQETVGLDYLNDPTGNASLIGANTKFGRNIGSVRTQRQGLETGFNDYRASAQNDFQGSLSDIGQHYETGLAENAEQLGYKDIEQGRNPFQYGVQSTTPYKAPQQDLSRYTPYTSFSQLSTPGGQGNAYTSPVKSGGNAFTQQGVDSYLGRTKTNLTGSQKNDWFNRFLMGKATS